MTVLTKSDRQTEDYYRALSRISRYRSKERLTRELLEHLVDSDRNRLAEEKRKADVLLENILPGYMIQELKSNGRVTPQNHDGVTVLFTDFVGFSDISRYMSPRELLRELTIYFEAFEEILEKYRIEKVKTVGDALMCVGGINREENISYVDAILCAQEMIKFTYDRKKIAEEKGETAWGMRAAIHCGSLVAGVVGHTKIAFDIWGHTVNVASRIESVAPAGEITISETVFHRVRDLFDCDYLGETTLKGVGNYHLFTVKGFQNQLRGNDRHEGNAKFQKLYRYMADGFHLMVKNGRYHLLSRKNGNLLQRKPDQVLNNPALLPE